MSRLARRIVSSGAVLMLFVPVARAQTIGDYSRAQRALLESTMSQAAARSAGVVASAPVVAASSAVAAAASLSRASLPLPSLTPVVQVSGVFAAGDTSLAEVVVNATAYLLGAGQRVPGTAWQVEAIAVDRVVLSRHGAPSAADADGVRKVFALPALR